MTRHALKTNTRLRVSECHCLLKPITQAIYIPNRPFALRGHVSFAAMLEGKQIGCYALLWKKWLPHMTRKGKYIKFPPHFLLCFKTMGYLQTCMMCTSLSDSIKNRSFIYCFKKSLSMFRLLQQFEHTSSLFEFANL